MILLDTNVLAALVDERDSLHERAHRDLHKLKGPFALTSAVLVETCILIRLPHLRQRLWAALERLQMQHIEVMPSQWSDIFLWLEGYASHLPDLCDAILLALSERQSLPIWTYDREFRTIWRTPTGKSPKVVPPRSRARTP